jgi:hypothetical protein
MTLDLAVSRAVAQSRLLADALHSPARWFVEIGGVRVQATKEVHRHGVRFTAHFTDVPELSNVMALYMERALRSARPFEYPGPGPFCVEWDMELEETVRT